MQLKRVGPAFDRIYRKEQNENLDKIEQANNTLENKMDSLISGKIDDVALQTDIEQKLNDLETQYAPQLTEVTERLADVTQTTVATLNREKGTSVENIAVNDNYTLDGIQKNISVVNPKSSASTVFIVNANVYRLSNFTSWGIGKTTNCVVVPVGNSNNRGMIDNIEFNGHDAAIKYESSYMNVIRNSVFRNNNKGIVFAKDSFSTIIEGNSFLGTAVCLDINGTVGTLATNTMRVIHNTFETYNVAIRNKTEMYVENCYFGDNNGTLYDITKEVDKVFSVEPGSSTYINNGWLGIASPDYTSKGATIGDKNFTGAIVDFNTSGATLPTTVTMRGSDIMLSSQNFTGIRQTYLYNSRSPLDRIIVDRVKMRLSSNNTLHNAIPYLLEENYSPLYSESPMKNYVINGTFTNDTLTNYFITSPNTGNQVSKAIVPDVTNQYGGKVVRFDYNGSWVDYVGVAFRYRVPKHMVGKYMVLEIYSPDLQMISSEIAIKYASTSGTSGGSDLEVAPGSTSTYSKISCPVENVKNGNKTPYRNVYIVKPTKENGVIRITKAFNNPAGTYAVISSITLSEMDNYLYLGQYEDYTHSEPVVCSTVDRPTLSYPGEQVFDTTLGKPIWFNGTNWKDASGTTV